MGGYNGGNIWSTCFHFSDFCSNRGQNLAVMYSLIATFKADRNYPDNQRCAAIGILFPTLYHLLSWYLTIACIDETLSVDAYFVMMQQHELQPPQTYSNTYQTILVLCKQTAPIRYIWLAIGVISTKCFCAAVNSCHTVINASLSLQTADILSMGQL